MKNKSQNKENAKKKAILLIKTTIILIAGLILFKYIPMYLYGKNILFDASSHVAWTSWGLYAIWLFVISNKKSWKIPYFVIAGIIIIAMAIQRIIAHEHNLLGVMLGAAVAAIAIFVPRKRDSGGKN